MTPEIDYLEETGPGIVELPENAGQPPAALPEEIPPDMRPKWDADTIDTFLQGTGAGIHMLIGQTEKDWLMTKKDLERIGPPLTRLCNRWEPALALAPVADPLLVAHGFALYGWRSALERKRAIRDAEEELDTPAAGYQRTPEAKPAEPEVDLEDLDEHEPYFPEGDSHDRQ
jgi:hypothetical protein